MKPTKDLEQLIDRAIANDRGALPEQPALPPADLLTRVTSTPAVASHAALTTASVSVAIKVGIVAFVALGSATWWALSRTPSSTDAPPQKNNPQQVQSVTTDSVRKPKDSMNAAASRSDRKTHRPAVSATPFIPTEQDLPAPTGTLETRVKDSTQVRVNVR